MIEILLLLNNLYLETMMKTSAVPEQTSCSMHFRTSYNYDRSDVSRETAIVCGPSLTKQSMAEECDINTIVRRFGLTGKLPVGVRAPTYEDFTGVTDFHSAMNAVAEAHESFETMPAHVREEFRNDPGRFVDFCSDPKNRSRAEELGLVFPSAPAVQPVPAKTEPAQTAGVPPAGQ